MSRKSAIALLGMLLFISMGIVTEPERVFACSCAMPSSPEQQVKDSLAHKTAIFAGTVTDVKQPRMKRIMSSADQVKVTFKVSQVWKGEVGQKAVVSTAMSGASCGYENFAVGTSYIVSAYGNANGLETGMCEMTLPLASASGQLAALGEGYEPSPIFPESSTNDHYSLLLIVTIAILAIGGVIIAHTIKRRAQHSGNNK